VNEKAYQILSGMTDAEWAKLILRLGRYAVRTSANLSWRTKSKIDLPGGETAESVASKAIVKVLSGERNWNPDTDPELDKYLMDVIDSLFSQLVNGDDNKKLQVIAEKRDEHGNLLPELQARRAEPATEWLFRPPQNPEEEAMEQEENHRNDQILGTLAADCDGDPVLKKVLEAMFDGHATPRSIAAKTDLTTKEVNNANKRLDTKIASLRKRLALESPTPVLKGKQNG